MFPTRKRRLPDLSQLLMEWPSEDKAVWIYNQNTFSFEEEVKTMRAKMDAMTDVYDSLSQKMHDVDKTM